MNLVDGSQKRNRSLAVFLVGVFAVIVAITLIANKRSSLANEIRFPLNNGVAYLVTYGDYLMAVCHDEKFYVWDWNNLYARPRVADAQSDQAALLESGRVISVKRFGAEAIIVTNLDSGKVDKEIPILAKNKQVYLGANRSGRTIVAVLMRADGGTNGGGQEVVMVDCNRGWVRPVTELADAAGDRIMCVAVSDDRGLVVLAGEKDGQGWVVLVDVGQKRVAWVEKLPDLQKVRSAVFSPDGSVIYIRGTDSTVQKISTDTGQVLKRLLPRSKNGSTAGDQHVQTVATSSDGHFMAASVSNTVYVWDCATERVIFSKLPGHKLIGGFAFSRDARYLATCDTRQGGTIKIWRIPKH